MRWLVACLLVGCSYSPGSIGVGNPDDPDATVTPPNDDAPPAKPKIYVGSETQFGIFDVETKTVSIVGAWIDDANNAALIMYELTMAPDGRLLGLTNAPTKLYAIDPATGRGTKIANLDNTSEQFWGASTAPAGEVETGAVVYGGTPSGSLFRIDPATGHVSTVGSFGNGLSVSGDIVWVEGVGLMGTMNGAGCDDCLARISPTTGLATVVQNLGMNDCYATGSVAGRLFVFRGNGTGYEVDPQTGNTLDMWNMPGATWSVAAP